MSNFKHVGWKGGYEWGFLGSTDHCKGERDRLFGV